MTAIEAALDSVWCAGLGAGASIDFRDADGELDEETILRYKANVFRDAEQAIRRAIGQETSRSFADLPVDGIYELSIEYLLGGSRQKETSRYDGNPFRNPDARLIQGRDLARGDNGIPCDSGSKPVTFPPSLLRVEWNGR